MVNIGSLVLCGGLPILMVFVLLIFFRWSAIRAMGLGWIIASVLSLFVWKVEIKRWIAIVIFGSLQAIEIIFIIFGALLLMVYLEKGGALYTIKKHFNSIQSDNRIQLLLIGYGFITVIEGVAGFGTPAALAAPLLFGLGFPPLAAAVFGLWFNAPNPPFGVTGLPTQFGVGSVIEKILPVSIQNDFMVNVYHWIGVFTGMVYVFWGILAIFFLVYWFGNEEERNIKIAIKNTLPIVPFALVLGITAGVLNLVIASFVGPELPDIIIGFSTLGIGILMIKKNILIPNQKWNLPEKSKWKNTWFGNINDNKEEDYIEEQKDIPVFKAWLPYIMVTGFLFITRIPWFSISKYLKGFSIGIYNIMGTEFSFCLEPLYLPGIIPFIPIAIITGFIFKYKKKEKREVWEKAFLRVLPAAITLIISVSMTQVMINSDINRSGFPGMMSILSVVLARLAGKALPLITPWIGVLGGFMTGSNTSSNILFSAMQYGAAEKIGISRIITIALQSTGGGIGNLISVLNIAAIAGVLGLNGSEGDILRKTIIPTIIYAIFVGIIGLLFVYI